MNTAILYHGLYTILYETWIKFSERVDWERERQNEKERDEEKHIF